MIRTETVDNSEAFAQEYLRPPEELTIRSLRGWPAWILFLLLGYSICGRSFAYLGIPPLKLFIGDMTLFAFMFFRPRNFFDPWVSALTRGGMLGSFSWVLLLSIIYGFVEVIRGIMAGFSPLIAIENLVFNVYPVYFFVGLWVSARRPDLFLRWIQIFAWFLCIYSPLYLVFFHDVKIIMPGSGGVSIFGQPGGGGFVILGLLCLDPKPSRFWAPMTVGAFALLSMQVRSEWLSTVVSMSIWGVLARKMQNVAWIAVGLIALLTVGALVDFQLPSSEERGGNVSSREIVARGLAAFSPQLAENLTDSRYVNFYAATISWRETWWRQIWNHSKQDLSTLAVGPGYGYMLEDLVPSLRGNDIRTPHNIFFFALGYSGWIGVVLFFSLQAACMTMLWRVYKETGQPFGLMCWASTLISAFFGNIMETPFGAIPFYLTVGLAVGPYFASITAPVRVVSEVVRPISPGASYAQEGV